MHNTVFLVEIDDPNFAETVTLPQVLIQIVKEVAKVPIPIPQTGSEPWINPLKPRLTLGVHVTTTTP